MRLQAGGVQRTGKPSGLKRVPYTVFSLHMEESNMKKMKRIISAALTLALAAGMLAGCAGSSSKEIESDLGIPVPRSGNLTRWAACS